MAWAKPIVNIVATKYGYDASELRSVTINVNREGDGIFVVTTYAGGNHSGGVRYRISVPAGASVQVGNIAGSVSVGGVTGNVSVETQAGTIDATLGRVDGDRSIDLRATTGDGHVANRARKQRDRQRGEYGRQLFQRRARNRAEPARTWLACGQAAS